MTFWASYVNISSVLDPIKNNDSTGHTAMFFQIYSIFFIIAMMLLISIIFFQFIYNKCFNIVKYNFIEKQSQDV